MTPKQRTGYFRRWKAVVRALALENLPKAEQEARRHALTLQATKGRTASITEVHTNAEITRLFRLLEEQAAPDDLNAALPVVDPEHEAEADAQRRAVFALSKKGLTEPEIARIAEPLCRRHRVGDWQRLPSKTLADMARWKQFTRFAMHRGRVAANRAKSAPGTVDYILRPSPPTPQPTVPGPY